jgi:hypothetical protein
MREALKLCYRIIHCAMVTGLINRDDANKAMDAYHSALSAPPRNCDRFQVAADALQEWQLLVKAKPNTWDFRYNYWLFAPAAERKGEADDTNG